MQKVELSILDIGHGNCAVLIEHEVIIVIDSGPGTSLLEFLRTEGIKKIDAILISHADNDHIGGVINLLASRTVDIDLVRLNTDSSKISDIWDDLVFELSKENKSGNIQFEIGLTTNNTGDFDKGIINIEILSPDPYLASKGPGSLDRQGRRLTSNSNSVVFRLLKDGIPLILLPGDIDEVGFENLIESKEDISAPIAVFPHHGGKFSTEFVCQFCDIVRPNNIIFSIGRGQYGTPRPEILGTILKQISDVRILCTQLSEHCASDLPNRLPTHLTGKFSRGQEHRKCCAGTIVVHLEETPLIVLPEQSAHYSFIRNNASSALCYKTIL